MQKLHFLAAMAVILGTTACPTVDSLDDLGTSFTTVDTANDEVDTSTDESGSSDSGSTTDATTDATTTTDTTDGGCGGFGCDCVDSSTCDVGLECNNGICGQPTTDTGTDTTTGGGGDTWDPTMCMDPAQVLGVGNLEGNFCSNPCTVDADCATAPAGTQAGCVLSLMQGDPPSFCALICSVASDSCPAGSTCKAAGQMDPDVGLCTYP